MQPAQAGQLAGHDPRVRGHLAVGGRLRDELRMAEGDGDRGTQLVRGVLQELPLLLQQAQVFLGDPLHLFHRGQPFLGGRQPPAAVPDHDQEHQRDQRDFGQVVGVLLALKDLHADDAAGGQRHRRPGQDRRLQPPQPEPVDHGQADPNGQERYRLPGRQQPHRRQVEAREHRPGDIRRHRAEPPQAVAQPRGDTCRPRGAVAGLQLLTGRLVAADKILRPHDPLACLGVTSRSNHAQSFAAHASGLASGQGGRHRDDRDQGDEHVQHEQVSSRLPSRLISRASAPEFGELPGEGSALVVTGSSSGRTQRQIHQIAAECVAGVAVREDGFDSAAAGA